jgi:hypothetical protein
VRDRISPALCASLSRWQVLLNGANPASLVIKFCHGHSS